MILQDIENEWIDAYEKRGALWIHDGNPSRPHALLSSGLHSSGFFNSEEVMRDPLLLEDACGALVQALENQSFDLDSVDCVVGPAMGAITLVHEIARRISKRRRYPCSRAYTEKTEDGGMYFNKTSIKDAHNVLLAEDVLTTGRSVDLVVKAVKSLDAKCLPFVLVLVNRTGLSEVNGKKIIALIDRSMPTWASEICPLCLQGSEALRPKHNDNWQRLNACY